MKKFYLFTLAMLCVAAFTYAQQVELVGVGMYNKTTESLAVVDDATLVDVTLFAIYLNSNGLAPGGFVNFWDNTPESVDVNFTENPINLGPVPPEGLGYYTTIFDNDVDAAGENIVVLPENMLNTFSFYAYVKRDDPTADYYSVFDYTHVHCWANGPDNTYTYELDLIDNGLNRNIKITMPFTGFHNNPAILDRIAVVQIAADGMATLEYIVTGNNVGDYYHEFTSSTFAVPAAATKIEVKVYSPDELGANGKPIGDSFTCGGVVADVTDVPGDPGCTYTQGYWKTHGSDGPAPYDATWELIVDDGEDTDFFKSGKTWYDAMRTKAKGNVYYKLAFQYIAANLNFLNGADPTDAQDAFDDATALFIKWKPSQIKKLKGNHPVRKQFLAAKDVLDDYNNGDIGPGHCDEGEEDGRKSAEINTGSEEMLIYPNPMSNNGTIDFRVANNGPTTVEMYNMMGAKVVTLFDQNVQADQKFQVRFDASKYTRGLYVIYIRNGSSIQKRKITIVN